MIKNIIILIFLFSISMSIEASIPNRSDESITKSKKSSKNTFQESNISRKISSIKIERVNEKKSSFEKKTLDTNDSSNIVPLFLALLATPFLIIGLIKIATKENKLSHKSKLEKSSNIKKDIFKKAS